MRWFWLQSTSHSFHTVSTTFWRPDPEQLPGADALHNLANGVGGWALIAAILGIVVGAVMWAFGHYSQNYQQAYNGRRGVMVAALAALLIGGAPHIVDFFVGKGSSIPGIAP